MNGCQTKLVFTLSADLYLIFRGSLGREAFFQMITVQGPVFPGIIEIDHRIGKIVAVGHIAYNGKKSTGIIQVRFYDDAVSRMKSSAVLGSNEIDDGMMIAGLQGKQENGEDCTLQDAADG